MAVLPCGIIFHLADLAILDLAGGASWMKTSKIKGGGQYVYSRCEKVVSVEMCKNKKAQIYPTV